MYDTNAFVIKVFNFRWLFVRKRYNVVVDSANSALQMADAANRVIGVKNATINFMMKKMIVDFEENTNYMFVMSEVRKSCKKVVPESEIY